MEPGDKKVAELFYYWQHGARPTPFVGEVLLVQQ
jgi:hypothetical protein